VQCLNYEKQINPGNPILKPAGNKNTNRALLGFIRRRKRKYAGPLKDDGAVCRDNEECKSNRCNGNKFGTRDGKCDLKRTHKAKAKIKSKVKAGLRGMIIGAVLKVEEKFTKGKCKAFVKGFSEKVHGITGFVGVWNKYFRNTENFNEVQDCKRAAYVELLLAVKMNPCVIDCIYSGILQPSLDANYMHTVSLDFGLGAETPITDYNWGVYNDRPWLVPRVLEDAAEIKWGPRCKKGPGVVKRPSRKDDSSHVPKTSNQLEEVQDGIMSVRCNPRAFQEIVGCIATSDYNKYCLAFGPQCTPLLPVHPVVKVNSTLNWAAHSLRRFLIHKRTRFKLNILGKGFYEQNGKKLNHVPARNVVCEAAFNYAFAACTSCCCPRGLANVYLSSSLSTLGLTVSEFSLGGKEVRHHDDAFQCREWFTMLDTLVRAIMNLARTGNVLAVLKATGFSYSRECMTAKACKKFTKSKKFTKNEESEHCACLN